MPSLVVWGRKMSIASDDLPFPAALAMLCHTALALLSLAIIVIAMGSDAMQSRHTVSYAVAMLTMTAVTLVVEYLICYTGCRGNMWQVGKRKAIYPLLKFLLALWCTQIMLNLYGSTYVRRDRHKQRDEDADQHSEAGGSASGVPESPDSLESRHHLKSNTEANDILVTVLVNCGWGTSALVLLIVIATVQWFPDQMSVATWRRRLLCMTACLFVQTRVSRQQDWQEDHEEPPLDQMAVIVHRLLGHVDMTYTDALVSIKLARLKQHMTRLNSIQDVMKPSTIPVGKPASDAPLGNPQNKLVSHRLGDLPDVASNESLKPNESSSIGCTSEDRYVRDTVNSGTGVTHREGKSAVTGPVVREATSKRSRECRESAVAGVPGKGKMLTPSHMALELLPDLSPQECVWECCGKGDAVPLSTLADAVKYHRLALAAYGTTMFLWRKRQRVCSMVCGPCQLCWTPSPCSCCFRTEADLKLQLIREKSVTSSPRAPPILPPLSPFLAYSPPTTPGRPDHPDTPPHAQHLAHQDVYSRRDLTSGSASTSPALPTTAMWANATSFTSSSSRADRSTQSSTPHSRSVSSLLADSRSTTSLPSSFATTRADSSIPGLSYSRRNTSYLPSPHHSLVTPRGLDPPSRLTASSLTLFHNAPQSTHSSPLMTPSPSNPLPPKTSPYKRSSSPTSLSTSHRRHTSPSQPLGEGSVPPLNISNLSIPPSWPSDLTSPPLSPAPTPPASPLYSRIQSHFTEPLPIPCDPLNGTAPINASTQPSHFSSPLPAPCSHPDQHKPAPTSDVGTGKRKKSALPPQLRQSLNVQQQIYREAVVQMSHLKDEDMVYDSLNSKLCKEVPYYIALDHSKKSIVIAIRGTLSFDDIVTDALCLPAPIHEWLASLPGMPSSLRAPSSQETFPGLSSAPLNSTQEISPPPPQSAPASGSASNTNDANATFSSDTWAANSSTPSHCNADSERLTSAHYYPSEAESEANDTTNMHTARSPLTSPHPHSSQQLLDQMTGYGHRGIMAVARSVVTDLDRHDIMPTLLQHLDSPQNSPRPSPPPSVRTRLSQEGSPRESTPHGPCPSPLHHSGQLPSSKKRCQNIHYMQAGQVDPELLEVQLASPNDNLSTVFSMQPDFNGRKPEALPGQMFPMLPQPSALAQESPIDPPRTPAALPPFQAEPNNRNADTCTTARSLPIVNPGGVESLTDSWIRTNQAKPRTPTHPDRPALSPKLPPFFRRVKSISSLSPGGAPEAQRSQGASPLYRKLGSWKSLKKPTALPEKLPAKDWRFVVTGHSLGAGVAAFLGLYLRIRFPQVPLKVWLFGCPACLMSPEIAAIATEWTTSVVLGKDMVSRLTLPTIERLRDELILAGTSCDWSKPRVMVNAFWSQCGCLGSGSSVVQRVKDAQQRKLFSDEADLCGEGQQVLDEYRSSVGHADDSQMATLRTFRAPGRIIFLRPHLTSANQSWNTRLHDAIWVDQEQLLDEGILISRHMMIDHLPDVSFDVLSSTAQRLEAKANAAAVSTETSETVSLPTPPTRTTRTPQPSEINESTPPVSKQARTITIDIARDTILE